MTSLDEVFQLFTRKRRRFALYYLEERGEPVAVEELATVIQDWESESGNETSQNGRSGDIFLELKHKHLPKAAEVEFIQYDSDESVVRMTGSPVEFDVILSVTEAIEQPWDDDVIEFL